jgi:hypothetical protein
MIIAITTCGMARDDSSASSSFECSKGEHEFFEKELEDAITAAMWRIMVKGTDTELVKLNTLRSPNGDDGSECYCFVPGFCDHSTGTRFPRDREWKRLTKKFLFQGFILNHPPPPPPPSPMKGSLGEWKRKIAFYEKKIAFYEKKIYKGLDLQKERIIGVLSLSEEGKNRRNKMQQMFEFDVTIIIASMVLIIIGIGSIIFK